MGRPPTEEASDVCLGSGETYLAVARTGALERAERLARDQIHQALFGELAETPRIGRYTFLRQLGAGGMGVVCAAYDPKLDRKLAIKLIQASAGASVESRARMLREAQAMARLSHPNVVQVYEVGELEGELFVAMEYVEGVDLAAWMSEKTRDWRAVKEIFVQAGRGLAAAHAAGLVHRDFKPANVLIGTDGRARVGDFGLARASELDDDEPRAAGAPASSPARRGDGAGLTTPLTTTGALIGTPAYMAPEQFARGAGDASSDQFAFCVALYEALYGARPFSGDSVAELMRATLEREPSPPADAAVPGWLRAIVLRGLSKRPAERWPSMDALLEALDVDPEARARGRRRVFLGASIVIASTLGFGWLAAEARERATLEEEAKVVAEAARDQAHEELRVEAQRAREEAARARDTLRLSALRRFDNIGRLDHVDDPTSAVALLREVEDPAQLPGWRLSAVEALEQPIATAALPGSHDLEFTPDGARVVTQNGGESVSVWPADGRGAPVTFGAREGVQLSHFALSPDGATVALGYHDGITRLHSLAAPESVTELAGPHQVYGLRWRDDSRQLMVHTWDRQQPRRTDLRSPVWDVTRPDAPVASLPHHAEFVPGRPLALTRANHSPYWQPNGDAALWGLDGSRRREFPGATRLVGSPAGDSLLAVHDAALQRHALDGARLGAALDHAALLGDGERLQEARFTPDGARIVSKTDLDRVFVWDVASASLQRELEVPPRPEEGLLQWGLGWSLSPDSTMVALGFADRTVRVLDLDGARAPLVLRGHLHNPFALAFSPDSRALATSTLFARLLAKTEGLRRERGDFDFTIRVWPIPERRAARFSAFSTRTVEADLKWISDDPWTADGRALIVVEGLTVRVLTPEGGLAASVTIPAHHRFIKHSVATDDGRYALLETARHWLRLELRAPSRLESFEKPPAQQHDETMTKEHIRGWSGVSSDGALVFDVSQARDRVAIYRLETGELLRELEPGAELEHASFSPGGDRVLTLAKDRRARVWSVAGDAAARSIELAGEGYQDARWIRGGDAVFLVSYPGGASARREHRVWRLDAGEVELRASVAGPNFPPVVTADGQRAALIDSEFRIQISTNFGARETVTLERVDSELGRMAFSPDGAWLISRATNAAYIWSTTTGELVRVLRSRDRRLTLAIFDPTGTRALLAARDGSLTVHPFDAEEARASLRERLRDATSYCYSYKRRRVDLNETPARAWATFAACERAYGRDPGERPEDE